MRPRAILFDFDYTLADSTPGIADCVNTALAAMGHAPAELPAIRATVGMSLANAYCTLAGAQSLERCGEFVRRFTERADLIMTDWTTVYAETRPVLETLRRDGYKTGIISTKFRHRIEAVLRRDGIRHLVDVIVGGEDVTAHKPAPDGLVLAINNLRIHPRAAIYVGDSIIDGQTARAAHVPFIAVTTGVTTTNDLAAYAPRAILKSLMELPQLLISQVP